MSVNTQGWRTKEVKMSECKLGTYSAKSTLKDVLVFKKNATSWSPSFVGQSMRQEAVQQTERGNASEWGRREKLPCGDSNFQCHPKFEAKSKPAKDTELGLRSPKAPEASQRRAWRVQKCTALPSSCCLPFCLCLSILQLLLILSCTTSSLFDLWQFTAAHKESWSGRWLWAVKTKPLRRLAVMGRSLSKPRCTDK